MDAQVGLDSQMSFEIIDGLDLGRQRRGGRDGAPRFPIEKLLPGQSFFVAASDRIKDPLKTLGSAVSAAKMKYATQVGKEVRTLPKRGEKNKLLLDDNGNRILESREVAVFEYSRRFMLRGVSAGQMVDKWQAPCKGCLVQRIK
jgi:hypothetical protein